MVEELDGMVLLPRSPSAGCLANRPAQNACHTQPPPRRKGHPVMLTIRGRTNRYCDGISRRSFLKIGALGVGAGSLNQANVFAAEARSGTPSSHKAVINVFLGGGPPHQDMWDIKTEAPAEIRGEFKPIATNVTGIQIGEVFPRIAQLMDKCVVIRSVVGATGRHDAYQCMTGWAEKDLAQLGGRPSIGAAAAKLLGPVDPSVPP